MLFFTFVSMHTILAEQKNNNTKNEILTEEISDFSASGDSIKHATIDARYKIEFIIKSLRTNKSKLISLEELLRFKKVKSNINHYIEKTRGMSFELLKTNWFNRSEEQVQFFDKVFEILKDEKWNLQTQAIELKNISYLLDEQLTAIKTKLERLEIIKRSKAISSFVETQLNTEINTLSLLSKKVKQVQANQLSAQFEQVDELEEVFELATRANWSQIYDTQKVVDRVFLSNFQIDRSVFMLKANAVGVISEIKTKSFRTDNNSQQTYYYINTTFDLCIEEARFNKNCSDEHIWIEYNPIQNTELNGILFIETNSKNKIPQVGDKIKIIQDGVTGFTQMPIDEMDLNDESEEISSDLNNDDQDYINMDQYNGIKGVKKKIISEIPQKSKVINLINAANGFSVSCQEYIQKDGQFGTIGKAILKNINLISTPILFHNDIGDLIPVPKKLCPNYSTFSQAEKVDFMIYYGAAIAMAESSCNSHIRAKGPNGTLVGQWQLHLGKTHAYANGVCGKINPSIGEQNTVCGLKMLNYYTGIPSNSKKEFFYKGNYWETMHYPRPGAKRALTLLHKFPTCHPQKKSPLNLN